MDYPANQRGEVRRRYLIKGPCQPYGHNFKKISKGGGTRRFHPAWFDQYGSRLEYSISKERAFCLYFYLFKDEIRMQGGSDVFVKEGFNSWQKPERLLTHMGKPPNSCHIITAQKCEDLMNQHQSIVHALFKLDDKVKTEYRIRLNASIDASRFLLRQGLPFRGHGEKEEDANKGNFLQLLRYIGEQNDAISKIILKNAPGNNQMISSKIQKDIVHSFAEEVRQAILEEIGHGVFGLLVDESADVSHKEQMGVVFRFVDKRGAIKERFIGVVHVKETSSLALKSAIGDLFARYGMSITKVRGQGYDGASNIRDLQKREACGLLKYFHTFNCVFYLYLMLLILGLTANLSLTLQQKDQDILNAMSLVESTKRELQKLRDDGWDSLMAKFASFCKKHNVEMLIMEEEFVDLRYPRRRTNISNMHHYKVNCFCTVLDLQIQEFDDRFTEVTTDLLICMAALSPVDSFHGFDKEKLVRLAKLYPDDFSYGELLSLEQQLDIYIDNIRRDERFKSVENLGDFSCLMVKTQKHLAHPLVYRLLKLVLTLPVATASVQRSARNRIGDQFLSDCMVCFIEKELFDSVSNEKVIKKFQMMNERRVVL
ncbi:hypothetical protein BRARA_D00817 [Brassica rapa]|uniref:TTF-type domain-containing protein n=1 Tax=Brassica campestris TaxID=3711 RepID=A0A397ZSK1_BRACM|nr:hypothetical protein BRARA_D00817 [Brassica rapa]